MHRVRHSAHPEIYRQHNALMFALLLLISACNGSTEQTPAAPEVAVQNVPNATTMASDARCEGTYQPDQITDLILATGQSNLIGPETEVAASFDGFGKVIEFYEPDLPHPRVFAWTVNSRDNRGQGWKVAQLNQSWHDSAPGVAGLANNNFAFHFAKQLAQQSTGCRVVGIVMVSEGGHGISHWDQDAEGWQQVTTQVYAAMGAIGRTEIDGVLWHQGESDWIVDGTCYPGDSCNNGQPDFYARKLYSRIADPAVPNPVGTNALIDRLRRQSWFGENKPFIAAQTLRAPVNVHLNKLNDDGDNWTACVRGDLVSGLEANPLDPYENHYSGNALRQLGRRYAAEYLQMKKL